MILNSDNAKYIAQKILHSIISEQRKHSYNYQYDKDWISYLLWVANIDVSVDYFLSAWKRNKKKNKILIDGAKLYNDIYKNKLNVYKIHKITGLSEYKIKCLLNCEQAKREWLIVLCDKIGFNYKDYIKE